MLPPDDDETVHHQPSRKGVFSCVARWYPITKGDCPPTVQPCYPDVLQHTQEKHYADALSPYPGSGADLPDCRTDGLGRLGAVGPVTRLCPKPAPTPNRHQRSNPEKRPSLSVGRPRSAHSVNHYPSPRMNSKSSTREPPGPQKPSVQSQALYSHSPSLASQMVRPTLLMSEHKSEQVQKLVSANGQPKCQPCQCATRRSH